LLPVRRKARYEFAVPRLRPRNPAGDVAGRLLLSGASQRTIEEVGPTWRIPGCGVFATTLVALALGTIPTASAAPAKTGYARSGDLDFYYEVHGSGGTPLVVLQGSFCTAEICFGKMLPTLAAKRQVILIDQQGHGHTLLAKNHPFTVTQRWCSRSRRWSAAW
jgi:hypothetical protein